MPPPMMKTNCMTSDHATDVMPPWIEAMPAIRKRDMVSRVRMETLIPMMETYVPFNPIICSMPNEPSHATVVMLMKMYRSIQKMEKANPTPLE